MNIDCTVAYRKLGKANIVFSGILLSLLLITTTNCVTASKLFSFGKKQNQNVILRSGNSLPNIPLNNIEEWQKHKAGQWQAFRSILESPTESSLDTSTLNLLDQFSSVNWLKKNHREDSAIQVFFTVKSLDHKQSIVNRFKNSFIGDVHRVTENVYSSVVKSSIISDLSQEASFISYVSPEHKTNLSFKKKTKPEKQTNFKQSTIDYSFLKEQQQYKKSNLFSQNSKHNTVDLSVRVSDSKLSKQWIGIFKMLFPETNIKIVNNKRIRVSTSSKYSHPILEFLKIQEDVTWIERKLSFDTFNAAGHSVIQIGPSAAESNPNTPLWDRNITGKGQIVGVGDTGIDWDNCFFYDPEHPVPFNTFDESHRKIVSYNTVRAPNGQTTNKKDYINGHGTHVCGSISGNILAHNPSSNNDTDNVEELKKFNGVAPDSKLYFTDLEAPDIQGLVVPDDLQDDYFKPAYDAGARIHSNSWGCSFPPIFCVYDCDCIWVSEFDGHHPRERADDDYCKANFGTSCCTICNAYSQEALDIDTFVHENDDMLVLFAAGNDGGKSSSHSVSAPAVAKNALAIGASESTNANYKRTLELQDWNYMLKAQGFSTMEQCCNKKLNMPYWEYMLHTSCCKTRVNELSKDKNIINASNVAAFSSRGPTSDDRIKPEVLAPGHMVHSMHSDGDTSTFQCDAISPQDENSAAVISMRGTSMSTPTAAGAAALVRQYLVDGFYPSGEANPDDSIKSPSASLIKAILIHSTEQKQSNSFRGDMKHIDVGSKYPNNVAGYGVLNLASVLQFADSDFDLYLDVLQVEHKKQHMFTINPTEDDDTIRVTLVWNDPPPGPHATSVLVNNLDLVVEHERKENEDTKKYFGNGKDKPDTNNNVEQVIVNDVQKDDVVRVYVKGIHIEDVQQKYSIVMTGHFSNVTSETKKLPTWESLEFGREGALAIIFTVTSIVVLVLVTVFIVRDKINDRRHNVYDNTLG